MDWTLIGKGNPQLPQMFYPVDNLDIEIGKGDVVAARCTMVSHQGQGSRSESTTLYFLLN